MKKEKEMSASFAVVPETAKVMATVHANCLKMEKALHPLGSWNRCPVDNGGLLHSKEQRGSVKSLLSGSVRTSC